MIATLSDSVLKLDLAQLFFIFVGKLFLIFSPVTIRLKSIKNIQKITKSMKMVAAAKYARAEKQLKPARIYGNGALGTCLPAGSVYVAF